MLGHRLPCETPAAHRSTAPASADTRFVLPATILGSSLSFIDGSVVNVALPSMQRSLGANLTTMQWVVNGYMLTLASLILLGGLAADHYGRQRIFLIGLVGFVAASLACGLAPSAGWLVAARLVQGGAAALLMPSSLAILGSAYTGEARGPAIGTWAAAGAITIALGPPLGGWLVDNVGWRAIFLINLPVGAIALWLGTKLRSDRPVERPAPLDTGGAALAIATLGTVSYGLIALGAGDRVRGAIALAASVIAAWSFIRSEARSAAPMLPLALFRNPVFAGANVLTVLLYAALTAALFLLPFLLIEVHGYSATAAGTAFLPFSAIMGLGSRWAGGLVERLGPRVPLIVGPSVTAAGFVMLGLWGDGSTLLGRRPARPDRCRDWDDAQRRAAYDNRLRFRDRGARRHGLRRQQRRRTDRRTPGGRGARPLVRTRRRAGHGQFGSDSRVSSGHARGRGSCRPECADGNAHDQTQRRSSVNQLLVPSRLRSTSTVIRAVDVGVRQLQPLAARADMCKGAKWSAPRNNGMSTYITSLGKFLPGAPIDNESMEDYLGRINGQGVARPAPGPQTERHPDAATTRSTREQRTLFSNAEMAARAVR